MNPTVAQHVIDQALAEDEPRARAEFLAEFRRDVEVFLTRETIEGVTVPGRHELPPVDSIRYSAWRPLRPATVKHVQRPRVESVLVVPKTAKNGAQTRH